MKKIAILNNELLDNKTVFENDFQKLIWAVLQNGYTTFSVIDEQTSHITVPEKNREVFIFESLHYCRQLVAEALRLLEKTVFGSCVDFTSCGDKFGHIAKGEGSNYIYSFGNEYFTFANSSGFTDHAFVMEYLLDEFVEKNKIKLNEIEFSFTSNDSFLFEEYNKVDGYAIKALKDVISRYGTNNELDLSLDQNNPCLLEVLGIGTITFKKVGMDESNLIYFIGDDGSGECMYDYSLLQRDLIAYMLEYINNNCI